MRTKTNGTIPLIIEAPFVKLFDCVEDAASPAMGMVTASKALIGAAERRIFLFAVRREAVRVVHEDTSVTATAVDNGDGPRAALLQPSGFKPSRFPTPEL